MKRESINIGVIGFGTVGVGTVNLLESNAEWIKGRIGVPLKVLKAVDLDWERAREYEITDAQKSTNIDDVINNPDIDIVVEAMGGVGIAKSVVERALKAKKSVVTPNKELIAKHGSELMALADENKVDLMFEGAVGGGIPIIRPMKTSLAGDTVKKIVGIVNGTTNYILTAMSEDGADFDVVLKDAQDKGYAEQDPTADIEGYDATYKLAILSSIAFNTRIDVEDIYHEGITKITATDIKYAKKLGYEIKLLAIGELMGDALQLHVHPTFVPISHPLAAVSGVFNAIFIESYPVGDLMFYGRGAGSGPTGSALVGDAIDAARNILNNASGRIPCNFQAKREVLPIDNLNSKYYVRTAVKDVPGVLGKMADIFGVNSVSITSVFQPTAGQGKEETEIVWITHLALEANLKNAMKSLSALDEVLEISSSIRTL